MTNRLCSRKTSLKVQTCLLAVIALLIFSRAQVTAEEGVTVTVTLIRANGTFADGKKVFLYRQNPFEELTVRIREDGTQEVVFPDEPSYQALTNDRGLAIFQQVSPGQYIMTAERIPLGGDRRCFEDIGHVPVVVSRGRPQKEIGSLRYVKRGVVIRGKVFIADRPAAEVTICEWDRLNGIARQKCVSGADGAYELYLGVTPSKDKQIALRAYKDECTPTLVFVNLEKSVIEGVDIFLEPLETWTLVVTSPPPTDPAHKEFILLISTSPDGEFGIDHPILPLSAENRRFRLPKGNWLGKLIITGWGFHSDGELSLMTGGQALHLYRAGEKERELIGNSCDIAISCKFLCEEKTLPPAIVRLLFPSSMILVIRHPKYEANFLPAMLNMIELDEKQEGILEGYHPPFTWSRETCPDPLVNSALEVWLASKDIATGFYVFNRRLVAITNHGLKYQNRGAQQKYELRLDAIDLLRRVAEEESATTDSKTRARLSFELLATLLRSYQEIETDEENKLALEAVTAAIEKLAAECAFEGK